MPDDRNPKKSDTDHKQADYKPAAKPYVSPAPVRQKPTDEDDDYNEKAGVKMTPEGDEIDPKTGSKKQDPDELARQAEQNAKDKAIDMGKSHSRPAVPEGSKRSGPTPGSTTHQGQKGQPPQTNAPKLSPVHDPDVQEIGSAKAGSNVERKKTP